jgi:hypothetical protein
MINNLKKTVLILICILYSVNGYTQGRIVSLDHITGKFDEYCKSVPREEVYIHTDREDYIAGEEMWFNIYVIDRQSSKPSTYSSIVYLELINRYNNPVLQERILVNKGSGPGQVVLPDSLSSGNYTLRAYTNWMKNFLPANCFMKDINIYNTFSSRAFRAKPEYEKIVPVRQGRERLTWITEDNFLMETNILETGDMEVAIHTNDEFRAHYGNVLYLILQTHGIINYKNTLRITNDIEKLIIPGRDILHGINHITLFETTGFPVYEKFIYTPGNKSNYMSINSQGDYKTREKISLDINIDKDELQPDELINLSISVVPEYVGSYSDDIADYLVFGTEFGIIPDEIRNKNIDALPPHILNEFLSTLKSNWIDWNVILFHDVPSYKYGIENEYHFFTGSLVNRRSLEGNEDEFIFLSTPSKQATLKYAITDSTGKFVFGIPVTNEVSDLVIQPELAVEDNTIRMESSFSDIDYPFKATGFSERDVPGYISDLAAHYQVAKIYETSFVGSTIKQTVDHPEITRFYGKPDIELIMDDYIKLPVMEEVFFELLPGVTLRQRKSGYEISIYDLIEGRTYNRPPGLFIDGVLIKDPGLIAGLDPEFVEKIDVVKETYFVGDYYFHGIINIITRAGNFSNVPLPDNAVRLPYRITQNVHKFLSPDYSLGELKQNRIPDFRNTLFWAPSVKPDPEDKMTIEFWASDLPGNYVLNVQGITAQGDKLSLKKTFSITR